MGDEALVYRLVPVWACDVIDGQWEFQSSAFDNATPEAPEESTDDMSVVLGDTLAALHRVPHDLPHTPLRGEKWGVAVLEAHYLRNEEQQELRRTPNEIELAHGDVRGKKNGKRRKRLKAHADWIVRPAASPS